MLTQLSVLWHCWTTEHYTTESKVSVPSWDPSAKGVLIKCECGRTWAL